MGIDIQIVSDLHLEFRKNKFKNLIKPSAPIICLLGDICACSIEEDWDTYKSFIKHIASQFKYVIHVPGNHEYYSTGKNIDINNTIPKIDSKIRQFIKTFDNVYYLNNNTIRLTFDNNVYVFIGTTLWTDVDPVNRKYIGNIMNDYVNIYYPNEESKIDSEKLNWKPYRKYNINDMIKLHIKSVIFINNELKKTKPNENVIILTHHKMYKGDNNNVASQAYETDLFPNVIKPKENLKLIAYGHTHIKDDRIMNNIRIVSNPKGYVNQITRFDKKFTVNV